MNGQVGQKYDAGPVKSHPMTNTRFATARTVAWI